LTIPVVRSRFFQSFDYNIKNVSKLTNTARPLDDLFLNQLDLNNWITAAHTLQKALTDSVITSSVKQLPPEIFSISGNEIINKLKARRDRLPQYATTYFKALAKKVVINGSKNNELFQAQKLHDNQVNLSVYRLNKNGDKEKAPYFKRIFKQDETTAITLFGNLGNDQFEIDPSINGIKITVQKGINKAQFPDSKKDKD
jgi:hypothetical protein